MQWIKSIGVAALKGSVVATAAMATTMASDGFTSGEVQVLLAVAVAGALAGLATLFQAPPRDPEKRERASDRYR
jgi:hypothetical protein